MAFQIIFMIYEDFIFYFYEDFNETTENTKDC